MEGVRRQALPDSLPAREAVHGGHDERVAGQVGGAVRREDKRPAHAELGHSGHNQGSELRDEMI